MLLDDELLVKLQFKRMTNWFLNSTYQTKFAFLSFSPVFSTPKQSHPLAAYALKGYKIILNEVFGLLSQCAFLHIDLSIQISGK